MTKHDQIEAACNRAREVYKSMRPTPSNRIKLAQDLAVAFPGWAFEVRAHDKIHNEITIHAWLQLDCEYCDSS